MFALIIAKIAEETLGDVLVADEVVINEKDIVRMECAQRVELAPNLLVRLRPRLAPEHDDDVAEFAEERTSARELQADVRVAIELQQIESRRRRIGERDDAFFFVQRALRSGLVIAAEFFPDVFGFAGHDGIGERLVALRTKGCVASAGDNVIAEAAVVAEELFLTAELHAHSAYADDVGLRLERNALDVLVDNLDVPILGRERSNRRESERWIDRSLVGQNRIDRPSKAPETLGKTRVDE